LPYLIPSLDNNHDNRYGEDTDTTTPSPPDSSSYIFASSPLSDPSTESNKPVVITRLITDDLEEDPHKLTSPYFEFETSALTVSSSNINPGSASPRNNPGDNT
jgi:hypothetical protein